MTKCKHCEGYLKRVKAPGGYFIWVHPRCATPEPEGLMGSYSFQVAMSETARRKKFTQLIKNTKVKT